jgi:hypothetical protein
MGQQSNKVIKRRRRVDYLKRKKEQGKLGGTVKKSVVKKESAPSAKDAADKAPAKKAAKKATKKAPAKKAAKKIAPETEAAETPVADAGEAAEA